MVAAPLLAFTFSLLATSSAFAIETPNAVARFIPRNAVAIAVETGDLNGDGAEDAILVFETAISEHEHPRTLLILTGDAAGKLSAAAKSDKAVLAREDGGMLGDPFQGIEVHGRTFTISHYGGSSWRWSTSFTFGHSRRDRTWQLIRAETLSFHAADPSTEEKKTYKPPRHFGKIAIDAFDPENFLGRGPK